MASPSYWGGSLWKILYSIALTYDPENKEYLSNFLNSLKILIPCEDCKKHFTKFMNENPPSIETQEEFKQWIIDLNNDVNTRLSKPLVNDSIFNEITNMDKPRNITPYNTGRVRKIIRTPVVHKKNLLIAKKTVVNPKKKPCNCGK